MDNRPRLRPGSHILCPQCRRWHLVIRGHTEGTEYTQAMLYFICRGGRYYAGQVGQASRHPVQAGSVGDQVRVSVSRCSD